MKRLLVGLAMLGSLSACSSGPKQDITKLVAVTDVHTGWYDAGLENGMNKLVPSVTLTLKNVSTQPVKLVALNAVIRRTGEKEEWGGAYTRAIGSEALPPGASTKPITLKSNLGYTGTDPRAKMLTNKLFVDASIQVFAKYGGTNWAKLGEYPIARELITQ